MTTQILNFTLVTAFHEFHLYFEDEAIKRFVSLNGEETEITLKKMDIVNFAWHDMSLYCTRCVYQFPNGAILISEDAIDMDKIIELVGSSFEDEEEYRTKRFCYYEVNKGIY